MAYRPNRPVSAEVVMSRSRMAKVDYISYIHSDYKPVTKYPSKLDLKLSRTEEEDVDYYLPQLIRIFNGLPNYAVAPPEPAMIYDRVYLGTTSQADNLVLLRRLGIKCLLNCAGISLLRADREMRHYKNPESGVEKYEEISIEDGETFDVSALFLRAHRYIDQGRNIGRVLVFSPDADKSSVICASYLIRRGCSMLQAAKLVKDKRKAALSNRGFLKKLIIFARDRGLMDKSMPHLGAAHFDGLTRVRDRPTRSHFLTIR